VGRLKALAATLSKAAVFGVVVVAIGVGLLPGVASAEEVKFHAHMNGYSQANNCTAWTWNSPSAMCTAIGEYVNGASGKSFPFEGASYPITIQWNTPPGGGVANCEGTLPAGYNRWMKFSVKGGWLCGAVSSTAQNNDAFIVRGGEIKDRKVVPSSTDRSQLEKPGGPLFLFVSYHGRTSNGKHGYVFGLRGYLNY